MFSPVAYYPYIDLVLKEVECCKSEKCQLWIKMYDFNEEFKSLNEEWFLYVNKWFSSKKDDSLNPKVHMQKPPKTVLIRFCVLKIEIIRITCLAYSGEDSKEICYLYQLRNLSLSNIHQIRTHSFKQFQRWYITLCFNSQCWPVS